MPKIHELLAAEKTVNASSNKVLDETLKKFSNEHFFGGHTKSLKMLEDTPANAALEDQARETKAVVTTVYDTLDYALDLFAKAEDLQLQKNVANGSARADVQLRGQVLFQDLPVDQLLGLESRLGKIREIYVAMPTVDATKAWAPDEASGKYVLQAEPEHATKTEKEMTFVIAAPATDKHQAQVKEVSREKIVGKYTTVKRSGAVTAVQKSEAIKLIDDLITEVKQARMRANDTEVDVKRRLGAVLKDLLLSPLK